MKTRDWLIAAGIVLCAVVLIACGGSDSGDGGGEEEAVREEARLEFAECMREHGVDMPDPQPGQRGMVFGGPGSEVKPGDPATQRALAECEDEMPDIGEELSAEEKEEFKEQALAFAQCMREHGVDMPDPQFEGDGKVKMTMRKGSGIDPSSPAFEQAQEACQDELPDLRAPGP